MRFSHELEQSLTAQLSMKQQTKLLIICLLTYQIFRFLFFLGICLLLIIFAKGENPPSLSKGFPPVFCCRGNTSRMTILHRYPLSPLRKHPLILAHIVNLFSALLLVQSTYLDRLGWAFCFSIISYFIYLSSHRFLYTMASIYPSYQSVNACYTKPLSRLLRTSSSRYKRQKE